MSENKTYSWALSENADVWNGPEDSAYNAILEAFACMNESGTEPSEQVAVYVGTNKRPTIDYDTVVTDIEDRINSDIDEQVGEIFDGFGFTDEEKEKVKAALQTAIGTPDFGCWTVEDIRRYDALDPSFIEALAAFRKFQDG